VSRLQPFLAASSALLALAARPALAESPALLPVQGYLTDTEGEPILGDIDFAFALYANATSSEPLYAEVQSVSLDEGAFAAYVGNGVTADGALDLALFHDTGEVWIGITVGGGPEMSRLQLGAVPYAAHADYCDVADLALDADSLGGVDADEFALVDEVQAAIRSTCDSESAIQAVHADGTVDCVSVGAGDITGVTAGFGLEDGGTTGEVSVAVDTDVIQARVSGTCAAGESIQSIDATGAVTCETDTDTTYSAGTGLSLSGTTFSADTTALQARVSGTCSAGQAIQSIDATGAVTCETDTDTTYSAGTGLSLSGSTFSADTAVLQSRVTGTCAAGSSIRTIDASGAVTCETDTDTDTTYSAGSGLTLSGTTFSADTSTLQSRVTDTCATGEAIQSIDASGAVTCEAVGPGDITGVTAGSGLTGGGSTGDATLAVADITEEHVDSARLGLVSSTTGEIMFSRYLSSTYTNGVTSARVMIVTGATQGRGYADSGGSGTVTVECGSTTVMSTAVAGGGFRPWTYITPSFSWSSGACSLDVTVTADSASDPVVVREISLIF
jgi:hypothetical protein